VDAPAPPRDGIALGSERAAQALVGVEAAALLLEAHDPQAVSALDLAGVGGELTGEQIEERRLAASVRADQPHARARGDDEVEVAHELSSAE